MLFVIISSLITICSSSSYWPSLASSSGLGTGCSTFLPLLKVIAAFTSSILGAFHSSQLFHELTWGFAKFARGTSLFLALDGGWLD